MAWSRSQLIFFCEPPSGSSCPTKNTSKKLVQRERERERERDTFQCTLFPEANSWTRWHQFYQDGWQRQRSQVLKTLGSGVPVRLNQALFLLRICVAHSEAARCSHVHQTVTVAKFQVEFCYRGSLFSRSCCCCCCCSCSCCNNVFGHKIPRGNVRAKGIAETALAQYSETVLPMGLVFLIDWAEGPLFFQKSNMANWNKRDERVTWVVASLRVRKTALAATLAYGEIFLPRKASRTVSALWSKGNPSSGHQSWLACKRALLSGSGAAAATPEDFPKWKNWAAFPPPILMFGGSWSGFRSPFWGASGWVGKPPCCSGRKRAWESGGWNRLSKNSTDTFWSGSSWATKSTYRGFRRRAFFRAQLGPERQSWAPLFSSRNPLLS